MTLRLYDTTTRISAAGYEVEDTPQGSQVQRARAEEPAR